MRLKKEEPGAIWPRAGPRRRAPEGEGSARFKGERKKGAGAERARKGQTKSEGSAAPGVRGKKETARARAAQLDNNKLKKEQKALF